MKKSRIFRCAHLLVLTVFLILGTASAIRLAELQRGNGFYEQIEKTDSPAPAASVTRSLPAASPVQPAVPKEQEWGAVPPKPHELSLRLSQFAEEYSDAAIWLQIPDTPLDYPVMLGADNQFYLNHLPNGNKNALGSLFLDYRTNEDSVHLIVYGHNGSDGKMFGLLKRYESQEYFLEHKTLTVATADAVYVCGSGRGRLPVGVRGQRRPDGLYQSSCGGIALSNRRGVGGRGTSADFIDLYRLAQSAFHRAGSYEARGYLNYN